jgi:hypothetical protein
MTSRERVKRTFAHEITDRVPINYDTNPTIHNKAKLAFGCQTDEDFLQALGVDYRSGWVRYDGPLLYKEVPGLNIDATYGFYTRWIDNGSFLIKINRHVDPWVQGFGMGLRGSLFGYFLRLDYAWGLEDYKIHKKNGMLMFSLGLDF